MPRTRTMTTAIIATLLFAVTTHSAETVNWDFDLTTTGNDVLFDSATSVNPIAAQFDTTFQITLVEVIVRYLGFDLGPFDVTSQVPPEELIANELLPGPAPVAIADVPIVFPAPPETPGFVATMSVNIDAAGFGHGALTNVTLGNIPFDLGGGNIQTVELRSVRVVGVVTVTEIFAPGDLDENGAVDVFDLLDLLSAWGACALPCPPSCAADVTDAAGTGTDCDVNVFDLLMLLSNWG